jgi:pimeloyl-ACP methyl ester carboxylesterase
MSETDTLPANGAGGGHQMNVRHALLGMGLMLILLGGFTAHEIQTVGGSVRVEDVSFAAADGRRLSALLYTPDGVSAQHKAPGILAIHGYINSRETQSGFAIEFARRGYVVLAMDQSGHGLSQPPALGNGFGGPDGLMYLRSLDSVDTDNIGLEGHSMGGWAVLAAAAAQPDGYRAMVLEGSAPGSFGAPAGTLTFPRNLAVVFSQFDEFSDLMWGVPTGADVTRSPKLKDMFGTLEPVVPGKVYGYLEYDSARVLHVPAVTHPGDHLSTAAIGAAVDWFATTLRGGTPQPARHQIWYWKELTTLVALAGMIMTIIGLGLTMLHWRAMRVLSVPTPSAAQPVRPGLSAAFTAVVPVLTYFPAFNIAQQFWPISANAPQQLTNGLMLWVVVNTLIATAAIGVLGRGSATLASVGIWPRGFHVGRMLAAAAAAVVLVGAAYATLLAIDTAFSADFRFWVVAFKKLAPWHVRPYFMYLMPMTLFFIVLGASLNQFIVGVGMRRACIRCILIPTNGFLALLALQYVPLLVGIPLPLGEPLLTILAIQFVALLTIAGLLTAVFQRATGSVYLAAFINALLVTWSVVAGQATHYAL